MRGLKVLRGLKVVDVVELVIVVGVLEHRDKKVEMQIVLSARFKHNAIEFV